MPQDLYKLPEGWEWSELASIAEVIGGGTPKTAKKEFWDGGEIVWLSPTDLPPIGEISYISDSAKKITPAGLKGSSARLLPNGAVVYSTRATIGKIAIANCELATNQGFTNFVCSEVLFNRYLTYVLVHFNSDIASLSNSTTFKEVSKTNVKAFHIPLPPLSEQKQIVKKLDALFSRIDDATARLNRILTHTQALFASALSNAINPTGKKNNLPDGWNLETLDSVTQVIGGGTPKTSNREFWDGDIVWLSPTDLPAIGDIVHISDSSKKITASGLKGSSARLLPAGAVVYSTRATIGKIAIADCELATNQGFTNFICSDDLFNRYLTYALVHFSSDIATLSNSTTFKEVNKTNIKAFEIPLPPLQEQTRIVEHLDALSARIQSLEKTSRERIDHLAALKASLLDAAFRGRL